MRFILLRTLLVFCIFLRENAICQVQERIIRTYLPITFPIDPSRVKTLVDLDLSYALATTLIGWDSNKHLVSALAESWTFQRDTEISFRIAKAAQWSDGSPVTADQVVKSLNRTKVLHGDSLKDLFDHVEAIRAQDVKTVVLKLNIAAPTSKIIQKLTEPMYGISYVNADGSLNLKKTTGPFMVKEISPSEVVLAVNTHCPQFNPAMARLVVIRKPPKEDSHYSLLTDSWPNLMGSSSLMPDANRTQMENKKLKIWERNLDKVFFFAPGPRLANSDGRALMRHLGSRLDRRTVMQSLSGFKLTSQFFPKGYPLFDQNFKNLSEPTALPRRFKNRSLTILASQARLDERLKANLERELFELLGKKPIFKIVSLSEFEEHRVRGDYDLIAASLPINDQNIEGAIGFFFGLTPPIIPNAGEGPLNFQEQLAIARKTGEEDLRHQIYREIFTRATQQGSVLPLFHYSSMVIAKEGIDLSLASTTDETLSFAKVRFQ